MVKKIQNTVSKAASYCCESANMVNVSNLTVGLKRIEKSKNAKAASYCCESSNVVTVRDIA